MDSTPWIIQSFLNPDTIKALSEATDRLVYFLYGLLFLLCAWCIKKRFFSTENQILKETKDIKKDTEAILNNLTWTQNERKN